MRAEHLTTAVILTALIGLPGYTLGCLALGRPEATISRVIAAWHREYPELELLTLVGMAWLWWHWFRSGL